MEAIMEKAIDYTPGTELLERQNDVYVFCLLLGDTRQEADPTKL